MVHDPSSDLEVAPEFQDFDPAKTALLRIDMQNLCSHPKGWMGRLCRAQGRPDRRNERRAFIDESAPRVRRLQDACRAGCDQSALSSKYSGKRARASST